MKKKYRSLEEMVGRKKAVPADDYQFSMTDNAKAVEVQALENPGVGISVRLDVAEHMGAFSDPALSEDDAENQTEGN